ncbi:GNAT family N-acetyltransferase [Blastopirellula sp. JC733]|nr:GNAT family N-acetyltransferase [Blastopirellula sediminis]
METLQIRSFRTQDFDAVRQLWGQFSGETFSTDPQRVMIAKQLLTDQLFFVGEIQQRVVAVAIAGYDGVHGSIEALAVDPQFHRQGIGRQLVAHIESAFRLRGCSSVRLQAAPNRPDIATFLKRLGYDPDPRLSFQKRLVEPESSPEPVPTISVDGQIYLSAMRDEDKPALVKEINALGDATGYLSRVPYPYAPFDADFWLSSCRLQSTAEGALPNWKMRSWAIRDAQQRLIGGIGLCNFTPGEKAEIGYWLAVDRWGQGIMTKVVRELTDFAFREYRLQKIYAEVVTTNIGSRRVLEKAGYQLEAELRRHFFRDGKPIDGVMYGRVSPSPD